MVKDHGSRDVTWKPGTIFLFWAQNPMYAGCSGATCVYTCCIIVRVRICGKIFFLALGFSKRDFKST
jgi:hypothetical protein